jgi:hypothetical protein
MTNAAAGPNEIGQKFLFFALWGFGAPVNPQ